ncbi:hypothetical protein Tco_0196039 [Tanacetum coccineum]
MRFGKRGKLNPRYIRPFRIIERIGPVAYRLELPQELSRVHNVFHVYNLKKGLSDDTLVIPLEEIQLDDKLNFVEEPVKIMDREVKQLKRSRIPIIKVCWNARRGPEYTWEREDQFKSKYPHLFTNTPAPTTDMSNSDELRHTDNTTLIPPRLPDTLPQVYHRRRPTLGLLILPSVLPFPPTIKRIARMSVLPIKQNLAERARISAINLDDYQLDLVTPPPSPSSPFLMAAYQQMIAETDPTRREEALTAYGTENGRRSVPTAATSQGETAMTVCMTRLRGQLHTILEDMDRYLNVSVEDAICGQLVTQLRQSCVRMRMNLLVNSQEEARHKRNGGHQGSGPAIYLMHENFRGTEGAVGLTRWFEKLESQFGISNVAEGDRVKFASSTLLDRLLTVGTTLPLHSTFPMELILLSAHESDMSNSDELRHTDNTTLVPPRLPDTLPQVYHRRRPTLGLLILPPVSPFPPTIRRTARISVLPIEPNLAERARISAINLDDYQLDPLTPPPSPSSPFSMAAYQRMTAGTDPTQREEALTVYGIETGQNSVPVLETALTVCTTRLRGQLHTILEDMDRYPNACLEELEAFMTLWDVKPRVEESSLETLSVDELITQLRQMCEDAEDRASNAQEEARQKRKEALEEAVQRIYRNNN